MSETRNQWRTFRVEIVPRAGQTNPAPPSPVRLFDNLEAAKHPSTHAPKKDKPLLLRQIFLREGADTFIINLEDKKGLNFVRDVLGQADDPDFIYSLKEPVETVERGEKFAPGERGARGRCKATIEHEVARTFTVAGIPSEAEFVLVDAEHKVTRFTYVYAGRTANLVRINLEPRVARALVGSAVDRAQVDYPSGIAAASASRHDMEVSEEDKRRLRVEELRGKYQEDARYLVQHGSSILKKLYEMSPDSRKSEKLGQYVKEAHKVLVYLKSCQDTGRAPSARSLPSLEHTFIRIQKATNALEMMIRNHAETRTRNRGMFQEQAEPMQQSFADGAASEVDSFQGKTDWTRIIEDFETQDRGMLQAAAPRALDLSHGGQGGAANGKDAGGGSSSEGHQPEELQTSPGSGLMEQPSCAGLMKQSLWEGDEVPPKVDIEDGVWPSASSLGAKGEFHSKEESGAPLLPQTGMGKAPPVKMEVEHGAWPSASSMGVKGEFHSKEESGAPLLLQSGMGTVPPVKMEVENEASASASTSGFAGEFQPEGGEGPPAPPSWPPHGVGEISSDNMEVEDEDSPPASRFGGEGRDSARFQGAARAVAKTNLAVRKMQQEQVEQVQQMQQEQPEVFNEGFRHIFTELDSDSELSWDEVTTMTPSRTGRLDSLDSTDSIEKLKSAFRSGLESGTELDDEEISAFSLLAPSSFLLSPSPVADNATAGEGETQAPIGTAAAPTGDGGGKFDSGELSSAAEVAAATAMVTLARIGTAAAPTGDGGGKFDSGELSSSGEVAAATAAHLALVRPGEQPPGVMEDDGLSLPLEASRLTFAKGSGVAEDSIPTKLAEEEDGSPDDAPQKVILAKSLGPEPLVYVSTSHGVELEVQAGSLAEEVHQPVTVEPRLQFVKCLVEESDRAPFQGEDFEEEFLAMTFVDGPEEASFSAKKPAKLRFFVGYVDEFEAEDGSDRAADEEIKKQVLAKYRPLTSPDGKTGWKALSPYSVLFPPAVCGDREVWVEVALNHFCTVTNAVKVDIPGYEHNPSDKASYFKADFPGFRDRAKECFTKGKGRGGSAKPKTSSKPMVRFGNATQEIATFTFCTTTEYTSVSAARGINAELGAAVFSLGGGTTKDKAAEGSDRPAAQKPITKKIEPGFYEDIEMPHTVILHSQIRVRIGVIEDLQGNNPRKQKGKLQVLDDEFVSWNRFLVLRPPRLERLCELEELDWPCTAEDILSHNTVG